MTHLRRKVCTSDFFNNRSYFNCSTASRRPFPLSDLARRCCLRTLKLLARFLGTLLQFFLQLLLLLHNGLGIARWSVECLGELGKRQWNADGLASFVDTLHMHGLALLHRADQLVADLVVGHATSRHAHYVWAGHGLALIDDDACSRRQRHAERHRDT